MSYLQLDKIDRKAEGRPKSVSEGMLIENFRLEGSPPVPPPPINYPSGATNISGNAIKKKKKEVPVNNYKSLTILIIDK